MIIEDNYLKYDYTGHYYYPTELFITEYCDIESGLYETKRIKRLGRLLHQRMVNSRYNARPKYMKHKELIDYKVFKNEYGERDAIIQALINFADLMDLSDHDLEIIEGMELNDNIVEPLRDANIYFKGEIVGIVPESEYYNGY